MCNLMSEHKDEMKMMDDTIGELEKEKDDLQQRVDELILNQAPE